MIADEYWNSTQVADYLGVKISTLAAYRSRGQMPAPDQKIGRSWLWRKSTIRTWKQGHWLEQIELLAHQLSGYHPEVADHLYTAADVLRATKTS